MVSLGQRDAAHLEEEEAGWVRTGREDQGSEAGAVVRVQGERGRRPPAPPDCGCSGRGVSEPRKAGISPRAKVTDGSGKFLMSSFSKDGVSVLDARGFPGPVH